MNSMPKEKIPQHHARRAPPPELELDEPPPELELDEPPELQDFPTRHVNTTRLPSIPERTYKSQRVELSADDEPLPACEYFCF